MHATELSFVLLLFSSSIFVMHFQKCVFRNINNCFKVVAVSNDCLWSNLYSATLILEQPFTEHFDATCVHITLKLDSGQQVKYYFKNFTKMRK